VNIGKIAVAAGLLVLLIGATPAFADSPHNNLSLTLSGAILSAGNESYSHSGGQVVAAVLYGHNLNPSNTVIHYALSATVSGLAVKGYAVFHIESMLHDGSHVTVNGIAKIGGMVPAESFPLGCTVGVDCTSGIPGAFLGVAAVNISYCHGQSDNSQGNDNDNNNGNNNCQSQSADLPMEFESAFLNPFGGPIVMASDGGEIQVIATYSQARVTWTGTQLGGTAQGSLAGSPVAGLFGMNVSAVEDLKGGFELDHGTIAFADMTNPAVDGIGGFVGKSTIPPGTPCPPELGFPPGTCQLTGFASMGLFGMSTFEGGSIHGTYNTQWIVPAVAFTSTVSATLKQ